MNTRARLPLSAAVSFALFTATLPPAAAQGNEKALIEDLVDVSKGTPALSEKTREALSKVDQDLHIQVFTTPT